MNNILGQDIDPVETNDWKESIKSVVYKDGINRAEFLIKNIISEISKYNLFDSLNKNLCTDYINTISYLDEPKYPGDLKIENSICAAVKWNAIVMVLRASNKNLDLGGHISSFQSSAEIYEVGFNHFFRASNEIDGGDLIYFQGHISPGIYSRAFLEGRLTENQLNNFRQEISSNGLSSYPHPKLMPEFWQFPTVSMGLSPVNAIYQAKFLKYLYNRGLKNTSNQTVYAFLGDGEMDEPESKGLLSIASREKLDNLIFIVNCNLQRLDGPVLGNDKIINELECVFKGAGWKVIKVIWGSCWDKLFNEDKTGKLLKLINETVDGDYQDLFSKDAKYLREKFFGKYPETKQLVQNIVDEELISLKRGGHDPKKIYAAFMKAKNIVDYPVVILMHTVKGYGMGSYGESMNISHQIKKIDINGLNYIRNRLNLSHIDDKKNKESLFYMTFKKNSEEYVYLHKCREKLYGYVPKRLNLFKDILTLPNLEYYEVMLNEQKKKISTTIAFVRILNLLLKFTEIKNRIVPIVADEARTFGMEGMFRQIGIYNSNGQLYTPQDLNQLAYYRESKTGQILQEGICEAGAFSSWLAAATSYTTNSMCMIPFYIFYSIFGFQRIGDLCWAAGDQQARGFLIGGTSGRTTLNGEGLQHADGHSHIYSSTIPNCISYDPAYAYELAVIINYGLHRMYGNNSENIFYYITVTNENNYMPGLIKNKNIEEGIVKGIYKLKNYSGEIGSVQLLGSGSILYHVLYAAKILSEEYNIGSDIYSVTSFTELAREGQDCIRWNILHPLEKPHIPYISSILNNNPIIISTDYIKLFSEQIRCCLSDRDVYILGTDGFGRSDSREQLRCYFEIHYSFIVITSLSALVKSGNIRKEVVFNAIQKLGINPDKINPRLV